jgi:pimeloyl-ACP methyl ester carboxylesterase
MHQELNVNYRIGIDAATPQYPKRRRLLCAGKEIHFLEWGDPQDETVLFWHGVDGTCWDYAEFARKLAGTYHVICPDSVGCGLSEWPKDPIRDVGMEFHSLVLESLLKQLCIEEVRWVGASRGGALGIFCAAKGLIAVSHLVLNDVSPFLPLEFRQRLAKVLVSPRRFPSLQDVVEFLQSTHGKEGLVLTDDQWLQLAIAWSRRGDDGLMVQHFSPSLANQVLQNESDFDLWDAYDSLSSKVLLIRGENSAILSEAVAEEMRRRGPKCLLYPRKGGHVDLFHHPELQSFVGDFLSS